MTTSSISRELTQLRRHDERAMPFDLEKISRAILAAGEATQGFGEDIARLLAQLYFTNSSPLPVGFANDPFHVLAFQDELQCKYTSDTVLSLYMAEKISLAAACKTWVCNAFSRFRLSYITVTSTFSVCPVYDYLDGEHEFCPRCDEHPLARRVVQAIPAMVLPSDGEIK
ncbi:MAG: hypothetical protein HKM02_09900 [Pseudomonadales bacterium]|nr:hypothetical protein [Pseudomonadales bacterium]